jgi:cytochrome c6
MKEGIKRALTMLALVTAVTGAQAQAVDGKALFAKNCAACHQATGLGIPGAFPALKGDAFVVGDPALVIATVLKGRAGMPSFAASLDDEKLGAILTYVRSAWGNKGSAVATAEVATIRSSASIAPPLHETGTIIH